MLLTTVIVTHNRRRRLLETLGKLAENIALDASQHEVIVVDNASTDGTPRAVAKAYPAVRVVELGRNEGVPARNHGMRAALGEFIALLDDDSYPAPGTIERAIGYMQATPLCGALSGRVELPDGRAEASAMPTVFIGCATVLRREAAARVGYFDTEFFRQAEEYDLSFRLWQAGYAVERFENLVFHHDKQTTGRSNELTVRMDLRNNLILADRYLPEAYRAFYAEDWKQRYETIGKHFGQPAAVRRALWEYRWWRVRRRDGDRAPLDFATFEVVFEQELIAMRIADWAKRHRVKNVVIADLSKCVYSVWRGCAEAGLPVTTIADNAEAFNGLTYRDVPVLGDSLALSDEPQGVVIANMNPAQVGARFEEISPKFSGPVLTLWRPRELAEIEPTVEVTTKHVSAA